MSAASINRDLERFADSCRYAGEVLRRWRLAPDWLDGDAPADDPSLPLESRLRRWRQLESLRILWRERRGDHDVEQTGRALSALARACLEPALRAAEARVAERHGCIRDRRGRPARIAILALGKLGGDELNFNSDLDLVYGHAGEGDSDGRRSLSAPEYFARVARELSKIMEQPGAHGHVWPLDTRLRPFGEAGAMVWAATAMEQYFLSEGRDWERYAWLKARAVAGDLAVGNDILERLQPFVFRRYLDYGLFDSLRALHREIDQRSQRDELQNDIKRGPGGIRELEFLIQSLQLLRGGREPGLRTPGFLPALRAARRARLLDADEARNIDSHYRFLRTLENRLQCVTGRQTHEWPSDRDSVEHLAWMMDQADGEALWSQLEHVRRAVRERFQRQFEQPPEASGPGRGLWPVAQAPKLTSRLEALAFADPTRAAERLGELHQRLARRPLTAEARRRLDRLMPELLEDLLAFAPPDTGLDDLLALVETTAQRSAYLALLHERPSTRRRAVELFRRSGRVAGWIIASPQLLDELLAPANDTGLPAPPVLSAEDIETSLNALARYRQAGFVQTAVQQLDGQIDAIAARQRLSRLAEQVLESMAQLFLPGDDTRPAIIGYGNLGAGELHYSSDLDLVFLHAGQSSSLRPVQRLINAMQLPLSGGRLYEIDTRLRPNGSAGMLVSSFDSFHDYQARHAWTWEHQALIRARCVLGDSAAIARFESIRREVLLRPRTIATMREELAGMRERQRHERNETPDRRLLGDLQFIAEFALLAHAHEHPVLIEARSTPDQLSALAHCRLLTGDEATQLLDIYHHALALRDRRFLERDCDIRPPSGLSEQLAAHWQRWFGARRERLE
ncbi:MAG: bifunctional [glutamate--ammonia ligase]-adenylyl-L-tyrosine phosphorylase/[glutamate--ammonia-ligase] adenylyltransferase [Wenzhouxiangellaceae bacterium]|nr:bifunctional [glutamate--ammonia ligase]-adenylyl-L-tyrosine phosphorylase/[glutamate--ammonia-ligase] adenylyltransferase [Wenzhouxiangellaceae bacterium]